MDMCVFVCMNGYDVSSVARNKSNAGIPAVSRVDVPRWRVDEGEIGNLELISEQDLNQVRSSVLELIALEFFPPDFTLAVDRTISS